MDEQDPPAPGPRQQPLTAPRCYLSSDRIGWDGLVAQAFHEPPAVDCWNVTPTGDPSLIVFDGGALRLGVRRGRAAWRDRVVSSGDLSLQPGAQPAYAVRWQSLSAHPTRTLHLRIPRDLLARAVAEMTGGDPARLRLAARVGFQDPVLTQVGYALWRELEQGGPGGSLYAQAAGQMLVVHLLRYYAVGVGPLEMSGQRLTLTQLNRVKAFVYANLSQDLSLAMLAAQAGFSPYHFARLFRQATGESPYQWVLRQRIDQARRLLAAGALPIAEVALACGFANQSHFTQSFRRHTGQSPRAFQREQRTRAAIEHPRTKTED